MEKLLHERLRELPHLDTITFKGDGYSFAIWEYEARKLADEIERFYIPRPRFEDGEPIKCGNYADGLDESINCISVHIGIDGTPYYNLLDDTNQIEGNGLFKRPAPKVLDADGVEIKVGDTVYSESDGEQLTVEKVFYDSDCGGCFTSKEWGVGKVGKYFTHEKPVFDAEGKRICKGDTVWHANHQWTVVGIVYHKGKPWVQIDNTGGEATAQERQPFNLTHREPDSLEKLYKDMRSNERMQGYRYADRLLALIERGA